MQQTISFKRGDVVRVTVERLAFEGPGVARVEAGVDSEGKPRKLVVFIEGVAPGDEVEVELFSIKRGLARGRVKRFVGKSPARVEPRCPHFGVKVDENGKTVPFLGTETVNGVERNIPDLSRNCGGCTWQFLAYEDQLKVKNQLVRDAMIRIAGFSAEQLDAVWKPIMGSPTPWYYRNKMDFSFARDRDGDLHLGLHMKGRYRDVTEINSCDLFRPWVGAFLNSMREFWSGTGFVGGELQSLTVRAGTNTGEVMVNLIVENFEDDKVISAFCNAVQEFFKSEVFEKLIHASAMGDGGGGHPAERASAEDGDRRAAQPHSGSADHGGGGAPDGAPVTLKKDHLVSVFLTNIHNKKGFPKRFEEKLLWGEPVFREKLQVGARQLNFEVAPGAFLQPNTKQAERFYALVSELADLKGGERVFDLFCGTGTIGICLAAAILTARRESPAGATILTARRESPAGAAILTARRESPAGATILTARRESPAAFANYAARRESPAGAAGCVTGLELNAQAVENARRNAELNEVKNIDFIVGDATKLLPEMGAAVDLIVVDPPRAGMTEKVIDAIAATAARKVIYVSCNPPTLARDLKLLVARGFRLEFVQAIDQFSQTYHVETVTMLVRE